MKKFCSAVLAMFLCLGLALPTQANTVKVFDETFVPAFDPSVTTLDIEAVVSDSNPLVSIGLGTVPGLPAYVVTMTGGSTPIFAWVTTKVDGGGAVLGVAPKDWVLDGVLDLFPLEITGDLYPEFWINLMLTGEVSIPDGVPVNQFFPAEKNPWVLSESLPPPLPAVPEPGSLALFGLSLAGLGLMRREGKPSA